MSDELDQAPAQSITDRIASKFGFGSGGEAPAEQAEAPAEAAPETAEAEAPPTAEELAELEWDGYRFKAPAKVKEALMRQDDYTRKTQALAEERKSIDHLRQLAQSSQLERGFAESVVEENQQLGVIDAYLKEAAKVDWGSLTTEQMLRHKVEIDQIKEKRDALKASIAEKRSKFETELTAKMAELRKSALDLAAKKISGFNEETLKAVGDYAIAKGLSKAEVDNVLLDPRSAEILWEASQFSKIKASTSKAADKATKANPMLKPGAASERMPADTASRLNFNKAMKSAATSGEKARIIEQRLAGVFSK